MDFYYRYCTVETTTPWNRPSLDVLYSWWEEMKTIEGVLDYDFYVVGGAVYDIDNTWDIDIIILGNIVDTNQLGYIIHKCRDLAMNKYRICVDPYWMSSIDFRHMEPIKENIRTYLRATLTGDEVKIVNGEIVFSGKIPGDRLGTEDNEYPLTFQAVRFPQPKHLEKPIDYNRVPYIKLKK